MYYHLHLHTTKGSVGDSIIKTKDYIDYGKSLGYDALAITDHGSLSNMYEFNYLCVENNIKPIIGCELYETNNRLKKEGGRDYSHLLVLSKNNKGLSNLLRIVTDSNINGMYYVPRTDLDYIRKNKLGEGLIATSACLGGYIPKMLKEGKSYEEIEKRIDLYKDIFDEFYLEIQPGSFQEQKDINKHLVNLSKLTNTKLLVTNDVHYLKKNEYFAHDMHVKSIRSINYDKEMIYPDKIYYMMSKKEAFNNLNYIDKDILEEAFLNTKLIAEKCNINIEHKDRMPVYNNLNKEEADNMLTIKSFNRLNSILNDIVNPASYVDRLDYELSVIKELNFSNYFLVIQDFIKHAKKKGIPVGPGRGSVCGSLVAYLLEITSVDPIKYGLLFERFLSVHRKAIPDIDLDIGSEERNQMFDYAIETYGIEHCSLVSTYAFRKTKACIRDAAKITNIPQELEDKVAKLVPQVFYDEEGDKLTDLSLKDSVMCEPRMKEIFEIYPKWYEVAIALEDLPKNIATHAAGTIISPYKLHQHMPITKKKNDIMPTTLLNLEDAELANFVKLDFLGLATLDLIRDTEKDCNYHFDFANNDYDDEKTWQLIGSSNTTGLFQISSGLYKQRMRRLAPKSIKDLSNCLALVRGPAISSGADQVYMDVVEGKKPIKKIHPFYDDATKDTNGILIYQEDLMQICVNYGFSLEESYGILKASSKKKVDLIEEYRNKFFKLGEKHNIEESISNEIWDIILASSEYLFNKSHGVAYSMLVYASAYMKVHYPLEFMKNLLTQTYVNKKNPKTVIDDCIRTGIKLLPADINISDYEFKIEGDAIRIGLCSLKSLGKKAVDEILLKRPFTCLEDVVVRTQKMAMNKSSYISAIFGGLFDSIEKGTRKDIYYKYMAIRREKPLKEIKITAHTKAFKVNGGYDKMEEAIYSYAIITNPIFSLKKIGFDKIKNNSNFEILGIINKVKKIKTKNNKRMCFVKLGTGDGEIDITVFPIQFERFEKILRKNNKVRVKAKKDKELSGILNYIEKEE